MDDRQRAREESRLKRERERKEHHRTRELERQNKETERQRLRLQQEADRKQKQAEEQRRKDAERRRADLEKWAAGLRLSGADIPAVPSGALDDWWAAAGAALDTAQAAMQRRLTRAQRALDLPVLDDRAWDRLEAACKSLDSMLMSTSNLKNRLKQGRASLDPRIEKLIAEKLEPDIHEVGSQWEATITPAGITAIRQELPAWSESWSRYAFQWEATDLEQEIEVLWRPRAGTLPVPPPSIDALKSTPFSADGLELPALTQTKEPTSLAGRVYRNARSLMYGLMSFGVLFGLRGSGKDASPWLTLIMVAAALMAVIFGFGQARSEREREKEKLREELGKKAESAVGRAVGHWLSRVEIKIIDGAQRQMVERREDFVRWYQGEVQPARAREKKRQERAKVALTAAQQKVTNLERQIRELEAATQKLAQLRAGS